MSCVKLSLRWQAHTSEPHEDRPDQMSPIEFGNYCRLKRPQDCRRRLFMGLSIDFLLQVKLGWKIIISWLSDIFTGHGPQSHSISSWHFMSLRFPFLCTTKDNPQSEERSVEHFADKFTATPSQQEIHLFISGSTFSASTRSPDLASFAD